MATLMKKKTPTAGTYDVLVYLQTPDGKRELMALELHWNKKRALKSIDAMVPNAPRCRQSRKN